MKEGTGCGSTRSHGDKHSRIPRPAGSVAGSAGDEKQIKSNKERMAKGLEPVTKAYKQRKEAEKHEVQE